MHGILRNGLQGVVPHSRIVQFWCHALCFVGCIFEVIYDDYVERWNLYLIMLMRNVKIPDKIATSCIDKLMNLRNLHRFCTANSCAYGLEKRTVS